VPFVVELPHHRAGARRHLRAEGVGVELFGAVVAVLRNHAELVEAALLRFRHLGAPDAGIAAAHRMRARVPAVEIADHRDLRRVRRPDCELRSVAKEVRPELVVKAGMGALPEQVQVVAGQSYWAFSKSGHRWLGIGLYTFEPC